MRIVAENFRVFSQLDWSPEGVCLLLGPNGAGKTTAVHAFEFLRLLFERGHEVAFGRAGAAAFRSLGSPSDQPVTLTLHAEDVEWKLRFPMDSKGLQGSYGEELYHRGELKLRAAMYQQEWHLGTERLPLDSTRCCAKYMWDRQEPEWMKAFVTALVNVGVFGELDLRRLRAVQPAGPRPRRLGSDGSNLWGMLASWRAAPTRFGDRFDWVMRAAQSAFPGLLASIEFEDEFPRLFLPNAPSPEDGLPPGRAPAGLLAGLVQLCAVAAAADGSLIAFDEPENHLHPHAIRALLHAIRERAAEHDLTVAITTHSPVVMNEFREDLDRVFVLEHDPSDVSAPLPRPVLSLHDEDWLAQARLGTLYDQLALGSPFAEQAGEREEGPRPR